VSGAGSSSAPGERAESLPPDSLERVPQPFYVRPTAEVARDLLGRYLVLNLPGQLAKVGSIVETEAYVGEHDRASHARAGRTARTAPMYEEAGRAYVYRIYGMYWCLNIVTEPVGVPCAVLIRAVAPIQGLAGATDGPGKLCRAYGIDGSWNRADLTAGPLAVTVGEPVPAAGIAVSSRVGVPYAGAWADEPLRFFLADNPYVSHRAAARARRSGASE
jgi:DNA-3-methyladenine glycosylase